MFATAALAACKGDDPGVSGVNCFPACRAGTVCSPSGVCVSACNPACGAGETCEGAGASARCVAATDGGATTDAPVTPTDGGNGTDGGVLTDAGSPSDLGVPPTDAPVTPSDGAAADAHVPPMNCGMPGQACCLGRGCLGGGYCEGAMCRAPVRQTGECSRNADCPTGQTCGGLFTCTGGADGGVGDAGPINTRGCFLCGMPPGAGAYGAACTNAGSCASGLCSGGRCTEACEFGSAGDTACAAHGPNHRCLNLFFTPTAMAPVTTLGVCAPICQRDADCAAGTACMPRLNYFADRMDFACVTPAGTLTGSPGDACNPSGTTTCRNILCVQTGSATTGYCTSPCLTDADCPAAAPRCAEITLSRPSGMPQGGRSCGPR